jgi:hypothetical protein
MPLQSEGKSSVKRKYQYPSNVLFAQLASLLLVIQFPLLTGADNDAGSTQAPGAQLLLINAGV